jgi:hypothetical protein
MKILETSSICGDNQYRRYLAGLEVPATSAGGRHLP